MKDQMDQILDGLKIRGRCVRAETHQHLAFFDIELDPGVKYSKLKNASVEIGLGLRSETQPVCKVLTKQGVVRLQVAMRPADRIDHHKLINGQKPPQLTFPFLLGETDEGNPLWMDMAKNPHLLIAGTTGSGKSVLLHNLIANILTIHAIKFRAARIHLVDPKRTEFAGYKDGPEIITVSQTYEEAVALLERMNERMERRYQKFERMGLRGIEERPWNFNQHFVIIDEMTDLLFEDRPSGVLEELIIKLAQKARAAGIYLILATQRPSKDVFPPTLKANFGRIACRTASTVDSMVVLDEPGAERLLGRGDALLKNMEHDRVRFQVAYSDPQTAIAVYDKLRQKLNN